MKRRNNDKKGILERAIDQEIGNPDKEDPKEIRRLELVQAATELFLKYGYRKTSMGDVATRAGVAKGTLYLYFQSKAELLLRVLTEEKRCFMDRLAPIEDSSLSSKAKLRHFLIVALTAGREMPLISRLISGDKELFVALKEFPEDLMLQRRKATIDLIAELLKQGITAHGWSRKDVGDRANVICAMMYFAHILDDPNVLGGMSRDKFAEVLSGVIVDGAGGWIDEKSPRKK